MSDKIPFLIVIIAGGCILGFSVYSVYKQKKEYFYELNNFVDNYLQTIMYSRETLVNIIEKFETSSKLLDKHLNEYIANKTSGLELQLSGGYLKKDELSFVKSLFNSLGTSDSFTQKSVIGAKREELRKYLALAEAKFLKNGSSSIKLGFLGGLLVSVICF